jgi:hypothetical protein
MALRSDGTGSVVYTNHLSALDGAQKLTLSFWAYPESGGDNFGHWVSQQGAASGGGSTHGFAVLKDAADQTKLFLAFRNNSSAEISLSATGILTTDAWNHVYIVYDGTQAVSDDRLKLYVGGSAKTLTQTSGTTPTALGTTDQPVRLFVDSSASALNIAGRIAEVALWADAIPPLGTSPMNDLMNALRRGVSPLWYPHALQAYLPLIRDGADWTQRSGPVASSAFTVTEHPPMLYRVTATPAAFHRVDTTRTDGRLIFRNANAA